MNTKLKIAAGVLAGLIAGTTLMGAAIAAPRTPGSNVTYGYGMMRQFASAGTTLTAPTWSEMLTFMNRYRSANGTIDMYRMRTDVASGKVTPPCLGRKASAPTTRTAQTAPRRGPGMMRDWTTGSSTGGYTMMGRAY